MTCPILGAKSYAFYYDEVTWGVKPETPTYYFIPLYTNTLKATKEFRRSPSYAGVRQAINKQLIYAQVAGQISMGIHGTVPSGGTDSLAETFLTWGFDSQEVTCPPSKGLEWAEGPDVANSRSSGLRVNSATLTGSAGDDSLVLSLDLLGKLEEGFSTAQVFPNDSKKLVEFLFHDAVFEIDPAGGTSYAEVKLTGFTWTVTNNLQAIRENSISPTDISANGEFAETFQFALNKRANTYDEKRRDLTAAGDEFSARLTLKGLTMGTASDDPWCQVVIVFPRLSFTDNAKGGDKGILTDTITCDVLKPMTSANGHTQTWTFFGGE